MATTERKRTVRKPHGDPTTKLKDDLAAQKRLNVEAHKQITELSRDVAVLRAQVEDREEERDSERITRKAEASKSRETIDSLKGQLAEAIERRVFAEGYCQRIFDEEFQDRRGRVAVPPRLQEGPGNIPPPYDGIPGATGRPMGSDYFHRENPAPWYSV